MPSFLQRLRDLDAKATPGPWTLYDGTAADHGDGLVLHREGGIVRPVALFHGSGMPGGVASDANLDLTELLRNHAARLADVVEAGKAIAAAYAPLPGNPALSVIDTAKLEAMCAALTDLDTEPT